MKNEHMKNFPLFHTVQLGWNAIKTIQCSSVTHCDALLEDYKTIRTQKIHFSPKMRAGRVASN